MTVTLALPPIDQSRPNRHRALTQTNSRTSYGGKLYAYTGRFSVGAYPNRSQEREPETLRFSREWYHDGEGWKQRWDSVPVNQGTESPYGLVITPKSSQPTSMPTRERGDTNGIPPVAKRRIMNMVMGMHREYGRERIGFATCTLPPLAADELATVNRSYGRLNQVFFQRCKREAERCGVPWVYVGAYEIQEKRLERWGQVAMHTHFVFVSRADSRGPYWLTPEKLTRFWGDALASVLGHDVPRSALTNVQGSNGNTGRELAKYQTKGSEVVSKVKEMGRGDELPGQWWTASKSAKEIDSRGTFSLSGRRGEYLMTYANDLKNNGALVYRRVPAVIDGRKYDVGIAGYFIGDEALGEFLLATADDPALDMEPPITVPRVGATPEQLEDAIAAALAVGDFDRVQQLVEQADNLFPHPDKARRERALADSLYICNELDRRREDQRPKTVYRYDEHGETSLQASRLGA